MSTVKPTSKHVRPRGASLHDILRTYDDEKWEKFVTQWVELQKVSEGYQVVHNISGANDHGIDVAAYLGNPADPKTLWDAYQCKNYGKPLHPSQIWVELGKLCYYTANGTYSVPRRYSFAAPHEVGPTLDRLTKQPEELRKEFIKNWDTYCRRKIISTEVPLEGLLLAHVQSFDFSIVGWVPTNQLIHDYSNSRLFFAEFEATLPDRPASPSPPPVPASEEQRYVEQLLEAYSEAETVAITRSNIDDYPTRLRHFRKAREYFYEAEGLNRFTRDCLPGAFDSFKQDILVGVEDVCESAHASAMDRLMATTSKALDVQLGTLAGRVEPSPADRKGACHHLANDNELIWKP